jgi:hypothetical protein
VDKEVITISPLPSSNISMYRCLNFLIWTCMLNGVIGRPSLQCCHHHLLFLVLILSLLYLYHGFPLYLEKTYIKI